MTVHHPSNSKNHTYTTMTCNYCQPDRQVLPSLTDNNAINATCEIKQTKISENTHTHMYVSTSVNVYVCECACCKIVNNSTD